MVVSVIADHILYQESLPHIKHEMLPMLMKQNKALGLVLRASRAKLLRYTVTDEKSCLQEKKMTSPLTNL